MTEKQKPAGLDNMEFVTLARSCASDDEAKGLAVLCDWIDRIERRNRQLYVAAVLCAVITGMAAGLAGATLGRLTGHW